MKIYKTKEEIESDIRDEVLTIDGNVTFECDFDISASINVSGNINALNINALNINALNINARDISARDISARDISALNINAWDIKTWDINTWNINALNINALNINAWNINALNINAWNINAWDIIARDISFFAICCAYVSFTCRSISGRRNKSKFLCLESEVKITGV